MTEILDLANSIAASKEEIRQAIVARGVDCGQNVPLADYADKINNMVVSGSVDNVLATNYTGAAVTAGDKVFIKQNATVSQSVTSIYSSASPYCYVINPAGTMANYSIYSYVINLGGTIDWGSGKTVVPNPLPVRYDAHGNMFKSNCNLTEGRVVQNFKMCQDDYALYVYGGSALTQDFYKVNPNNNFEIMQTWSVVSGSTFEGSASICTVIGNKLYVSTYTGSTFHRVGTIDENSATITIDTEPSGKIVLYSTKDNALAIVATSAAQTSGYFDGLSLVNVNEDYTLGTQFVSANTDLNNLLSMNHVYVIFNRNTGVLCLSTYDSDSYYGVFKYENGDFTTVNITLDGFTPETYQWLSVSDDMSKLLIGRYLYTLAQTGDGNYKAIPYSTYDMGSDVLTGVALDSAEVGNTFNVKTILP